MAGQVIHFPYTQAPLADTDRLGFVILVFGATGLTVVFLAFTMMTLRLRAKSLLLTAVLGCTGMLFAEPFLAHAASPIWAKLYSQDQAASLSVQAEEKAAQLGFVIPIMPWAGISVADVPLDADASVE